MKTLTNSPHFITLTFTLVFISQFLNLIYLYYFSSSSTNRTHRTTPITQTHEQKRKSKYTICEITVLYLQLDSDSFVLESISLLPYKIYIFEVSENFTSSVQSNLSHHQTQRTHKNQ